MLAENRQDQFRALADRANFWALVHLIILSHFHALHVLAISCCPGAK